MKKFIIAGTFCAVALLGVSNFAQAEETAQTTATSDNSGMLAKIQGLMKMIADLQAKLAQVRGEVQELTKDLSLGAKDDDVLKAQEILASDPALFGVKPTGYFGPMTEAALKKFQERYGLEVTGKLDASTRDVMKELRKERKDGRVPAGLIKSDEVKQQVKDRLKEKWKDCDFELKFRANVCEKVKDKKDDSSDEDSDDDSSSTATREEATDAIREAAAAVVAYAKEVDQMEEDGVDEDELDDARDILKDARKKLADARRALVKKEYGDAVEKAESAVEKISGDEEDEEEDDEEDDD